MRQVSEANLPFIVSRIDMVRKLLALMGPLDQRLQSILPQLPYLSLRNYKELCQAVLKALPPTTEPPGGYVRLSLTEKLDLAAYDKIYIVFSPEIGLGDEVTFFQLLRNFPLDRCEIWSTIPEMWQGIGFPEVKDYRDDPNAPFRSLHYNAGKGKQLALNIGFLDGEFLKAAIHSYKEYELAQISLGDCRMDYWKKGKCIQRFRPPVEELNNYEYMLYLQQEAFSCVREAAEIFAPFQRRSPEAPGRLRVLVNPMTSKKMVISPSQWASLVSAIVLGREKSPTAEVAVLPGFTEATRTYAGQVATLLRSQLPGCKADILRGSLGIQLDQKSTIPRINEYLATADLIVGIDTFTAHLASLFDVPAFTVFYREDGVFRVPSPSQVNLHWSAGIDRIVEAARTYLQLSYPTKRAALSNTQAKVAARIFEICTGLRSWLLGRANSDAEARDMLLELIEAREDIRMLLGAGHFSILSQACGRPQIFDLHHLDHPEAIGLPDLRHFAFSWLNSPLTNLIEKIHLHEKAKPLAT